MASIFFYCPRDVTYQALPKIELGHGAEATTVTLPTTIMDTLDSGGSKRSIIHPTQLPLRDSGDTAVVTVHWETVPSITEGDTRGGDTGLAVDI
jgi:hypothetical protein